MVSRSWKPDGYTSAAPYIIAGGAQRVIDFLVATFGAEPLRRFDAPDGGGIIHAEVRVGDTVIMVADAANEWPPVPTHVHVYVEDVDAAFRRALEAGGTELQEPTRRQGDDDRRGGVVDPVGNTWWIATQQP